MAVNLMVVGTEGKAVETEGYFISLNHTHTHRHCAVRQWWKIDRVGAHMHV